jgi:prepilin-type N-terminal cleavage/methylation domain-containing protein
MNPRPANKSARGFTLIEVVISAALMSLILMSAYLCLNAGVASQKLIEPRADILQSARVALALLSADLRNACPLSKDYQFLGTQRKLGEMEADNLDFATHNYTPRRAREGDFCEISYFVNPDPETGGFKLCRRRNPTIAPDPLTGGRCEDIATGLTRVQFEYFDGFDWYDTWGEIKPKGPSAKSDQPNMTGMPEAVRITLWFDSSPKSKPAARDGERKVQPPLVFQTVTRLELADSSQNTTATGNTGNTSGGQPGANGQPGAGGGQPGMGGGGF